MIKSICRICIFILMLSVSVTAISFDTDKYEEVKSSMVKADPQEYKNKKIVYSVRFDGFETYRNEFILHSYSSRTIPIIALKREFSERMGTFNCGDRVKVYGRVKKYTSSRRHGYYCSGNKYYLDLEHIELISTKNEKCDSEDENKDDNDKGCSEKNKDRDIKNSKKRETYKNPPSL